jgi:hypothetical protein
MKILNQVLTVSIAFFLSACASVGTHTEKKGVQGGLVYFMPKKDFVIKVTTTSSKESAPKGASKENAPEKGSSTTKTTVVSTVTDAYPDFEQQYVLTYKFNLFGDNELDLGINEKGLLTSAKAKTVSKVNEALENLGKSAGSAGSVATPMAPGGGEGDRVSCQNDGEYIFIYDKPINDKDICDDLKLDIVQIDKEKYNNTTARSPNSDGSQEDRKIKYGIYYRQLVPYKITVKSARSSIHHENIVYSPSDSKIHFLPISRTFFANNEIDFGFTDGIPTKYVQKTNSELVGLFMLPGSLIGGFLEGVTSGLKNILDVKGKEKDIVEASTVLEVAKLKHEKCIAALAAKNDDLVKDTCS